MRDVWIECLTCDLRRMGELRGISKGDGMRRVDVEVWLKWRMWMGIDVWRFTGGGSGIGLCCPPVR
jgi:hypothetical protein